MLHCGHDGGSSGGASDDEYDSDSHELIADQELSLDDDQLQRHFKVEAMLMHNERGCVDCKVPMHLTRSKASATQGDSSIINDLKEEWEDVVLLLRAMPDCIDLEVSFVNPSYHKELCFWRSRACGGKRSSTVNTTEIPSSYHWGQEAIKRFSGLFFAILCSAWLSNMPNLVKLVVGLRPWLVCPRLADQGVLVSTLMTCDTMPQVVKLLLEFNPSLLDCISDHHQSMELFPAAAMPAGNNIHNLYNPSSLLNQDLHNLAPLILMGQEYKPSILHWKRSALNAAVGKPHLSPAIPNMPRSLQDVQRCYSDSVSIHHMLQDLESHWKFNASISGLRSPWSKILPNQLWQTIKLEILMEPKVLPNRDLALRISNLKFHNNGYNRNTSSSEFGFFLSHVAVSVTPEVAAEDCSVKFGLESPNPVYDFSVAKAVGTNAGVSGKGLVYMGCNFTRATSVTTKSVTAWNHAQTLGTDSFYDFKSGTFSWTLKNLGGIPFNYQNPNSFPRSISGSVFHTGSSCNPSATAAASLPFNDDGSVIFTDRMYPDTITWLLTPKLKGTTIAWRVSVEVCVTMLNNSSWSSRKRGQTLKFCFPSHMQKELNVSSSDLQQVSPTSIIPKIF